MGSIAVFFFVRRGFFNIVFKSLFLSFTDKILSIGIEDSIGHVTVQRDNNIPPPSSMASLPLNELSSSNVVLRTDRGE